MCAYVHIYRFPLTGLYSNRAPSTMHFLHVLASTCFCLARASDEGEGLLLPAINAGELTTPEKIYTALEPAWKTLVEERNNAGMVGPKEEGKPQAPLGKGEAGRLYQRVSQGQVDSARLLLVFGVVPSAGHMDEATKQALAQERDAASDENNGSNQSSDNLPALLDPKQRYPDGSTPLHMAATFGYVESIGRLLDAGAEINATANSGVQAMHAAAIMGHVASVERLASRNADVDARHGFMGNTPMHFAAEMGHTEVVRRLCKLGADVEAEKSQGGTPLHVTADSNNAAVARVLLEDPCNADPEPLLLGDTVPVYLAAGRGFHEVIDVLLEAGANPDRTLWDKRPPKKKGGKGSKEDKKAESTDLIVGSPASKSHFLPGSHPDAPGFEKGNGATPLHMACENGHLKAVKSLLDGGARQLNTMEGVTPLITALQYKQPAIAVTLLDSKVPANVNVASPRDGQTALHLAVAYGYPEVVARIVHQGGRVEARDSRGSLAADYARGPQGPLCHFIVTRFAGRDAVLDKIFRSRTEDGDLEELLLKVDATDALDDTKKRYKKYLRMAVEDSFKLQDEGERLVRMLSKQEELTDEQRDGMMQKFSVIRFLLSGGSDIPIAVESMMQKTELAMHAGLVFLGIKVESLEHAWGKYVKVNGRDVTFYIKTLIKTARASSGGDATEVEAIADALVSTIAGGSEDSKSAEAPEGESHEREEWAEL
eukprot:TRINITY_DN92816_c0_g1_i1.p1 TRINITY_DN92816_c0_g1~~TRINITY_DN92816_c0_g1_i1.p1  ORF type:complete len:713 (-),score=170.54 TRINITY_DN92816_c0_g1_i1:27-2165(-)